MIAGITLALVIYLSIEYLFTMPRENEFIQMHKSIALVLSISNYCEIHENVLQMHKMQYNQKAFMHLHKLASLRETNVILLGIINFNFRLSL